MTTEAPAAPKKPTPRPPTPQIVEAVQRRERPLAARQTRKPTGAPSWPVLLLAGREKTGKSWQIAQASASPLIGATYWITWGEKDADEYGALPGADFEIVPHDGTLADLYDAICWAASQSAAVEGKPNLIAVDSGTRIWDTLRDEATAAAIARGSFDKNGEPSVGMDLWNKATNRWAKILEALRQNNGPVIITARLDTSTVVDERGKPTAQKVDKIKGQRNLAYDVDAIIEMPERGSATLAGVRSVRFQLARPLPLDWFDSEGVDGLWRRLELDKLVAQPAAYAEPVNPEVM